MGLSNNLSCEALLLLPQPPRAFSIRGLRLYFPELEPWVARSASLPAIRPVYLCVNVGLQGLLVVRLPAPFIPHSASLVLPWPLESSLPRLPVSAPPTGLDECLFFISLVSDFLAVRFSVSSGCARRRSVSTYAAILVLLLSSFLYSPLYGSFVLTSSILI